MVMGRDTVRGRSCYGLLYLMRMSVAYSAQALTKGIAVKLDRAS